MQERPCTLLHCDKLRRKRRNHEAKGMEWKRYAAIQARWQKINIPSCAIWATLFKLPCQTISLLHGIEYLATLCSKATCVPQHRKENPPLACTKQFTVERV